MDNAFTEKIAAELNLKPTSVRSAAELLDGGATIPFIARYRKEMTGSMDEVRLTAIRDRLAQLRELEKRRATVLESVDKQGKLTDELKEKILAASTLSVLEDIYLPYKPKRRTRATVAREKGLEPLAALIFEQGPGDIFKEAEKYLSEEKKVAGNDDALAGARDIIAEWINENAEARAVMRELFFAKGVFRARVLDGKEEDGGNYKDYFDWHEAVRTIPSHRMLAVRRAEKEEVIYLRVEVPETEAVETLKKLFIKNDSASAVQVAQALEDSYRRLLSPSMETEIRLYAKEKADREAITVFAKNLRQLLLAPPLGQRRVMAIDPAYRTGCKIVCLNAQGRVESHTTVFPLAGAEQKTVAGQTVASLCRRHKIEFIAIGNGTASRETESFIRRLDLPEDIAVVIVSEQGASIYSASDAAREEFPDFDVTVRGAVSIGRRLMDPLAELVKIDPKSIGVGQYQHDVDQKRLKQCLDDVVISCVNLVGVELNTASKELLTYVSGLGPSRAATIVAHRDQNGPFAGRDDLWQVTGLGPKAIEQAAGFLRIRDSDNPLDKSAVHPERYELVETMARDLQCRVGDLMTEAALREKIDLNKYVSEAIGLPTLQDIYDELAKPGRDPRKRFEAVRFAEGVERPEDLAPGMRLAGVVTNITNFGVFVDIGVHLDGLCHISELSEKFVRRPADVVALHQKVQVTVLSVDLKRRRIALSMKRPANGGPVS